MNRFRKFISVLIALAYVLTNTVAYANNDVRDLFDKEYRNSETLTPSIYTDNFINNVKKLGYEIEYVVDKKASDELIDDKGYKYTALYVKLKEFESEFYVSLFRLPNDNLVGFSDELTFTVEFKGETFKEKDKELYETVLKALFPSVTQDEIKSVLALEKVQDKKLDIAKVNDREYLEISKRPALTGGDLLTFVRYYDYAKLGDNVNADNTRGYTALSYEDIMNQKVEKGTYHSFKGKVISNDIDKKGNFYLFVRRDGKLGQVYYGIYSSAPDEFFLEDEWVTVEAKYLGLVQGAGRVLPKIEIIKVYK